MKSTNYLAFHPEATFIRYISAGKLTRKYNDVLRFLANVGKNAPVRKMLIITSLVDLISYILSEENDFLDSATDEVINIHDKSAPFHANSFHWYGMICLYNHYVLHLE